MCSVQFGETLHSVNGSHFLIDAHCIRYIGSVSIGSHCLISKCLYMFSVAGASYSFASTLYLISVRILAIHLFELPKFYAAFVCAKSIPMYSLTYMCCTQIVAS